MGRQAVAHRDVEAAVQEANKVKRQFLGVSKEG